VNIWLISPYHTGSHQAWVEGYTRHSRHTMTWLTMPGRFWKWRMQGGAIELAAQAVSLLHAGKRPDAILATDMLNLPAWLGLLRGRLPSHLPVALYMHENQLTYPWRPGEGRDLTYAMINWLSQLAADAVIFNSQYHHNIWYSELPNLLKHFPDYTHLAQIDPVRARSHVLPVGIDAQSVATAADHRRADFRADTRAVTQPPLILWNQRWEHDKRPDRFFSLLYRLRDQDVPYQLAVAGENFRQIPAEFDEARVRLSDCIIHWGYAESREVYLDLLATSDLVVSTADHEFFGISVLEAVAAGAFPLLPNRLSYPELIPTQMHPACLYRDEADLLAKAAARLRVPRPASPSLRAAVVERYDWVHIARAYDDLLERLAGAGSFSGGL
jgi:glycosyltransferase involved in cell wall biosynthesis